MKLTIAGAVALVAALASTPAMAGGRGSWGHDGWRPLGGRPGWDGYSGLTLGPHVYARRFVEPFRGGWGGTVLPPPDYANPQPLPPPVVVHEQSAQVVVPPTVVTPPPQVVVPPVVVQPQVVQPQVVVPPVVVQPQVVPPVVQAPPPVVVSPWKAVKEDYRRIGFDAKSFTNIHGNTWNVWVSSASGNTLIFPNSKGYRGDPYGYNCLPVTGPNKWARCTRYNLITGVENSPVWGVRVTIYSDGTVDDEAN